MSPESLELSLVVILTGLVVVFAALIGLTALIWAFGKIFTTISGKGSKGDKNEKVEAPKAETKSTPTVSAAVTTDEEDDVVAAISAAVAWMLGSGKGFVVRSIRRVKESRPVWAQAGLLENTKPF